MRNKALTILFFCFNLISTSQEGTITSEIKANIKARVNAGDNTSIVVGYNIDGDNVEFYSYGKLEVDGGIDADENSVFEIGSISKVFTAILLADKIVNEEMRLSDAISKYLPKEVTTPSRNGKEITLKDLATHSSGLPRLPSNLLIENLNQPYVNYTNDDMYEFISNYELTTDIGERWQYSNYGVGLLGHILELQSKKSYEELLFEKITMPLEMNSTAVHLNTELKSRLAFGHKKGKKLLEGHDMLSLAGAGGIRSTAKDLIRFSQANLLNTELPIKKAMLLSHKQAFKDMGRNRTIGLGWFLSNNGTLIWHGGNTPGYASFIGFDKNTTKGVVVLTNSAGNVQDIGRRLLGSTLPLTKPR